MDFEKNEIIKNVKNSIIKKLKKRLPLIAVILILVIVAITLTVKFMTKNDEESISIVTKSSLQQVLEISKLSTIEYTYNAVAAKHDEKGKVIYHVAYEGKVNIGIDLMDVTFEIIDETKTSNNNSASSSSAPLKKVIITVPDVNVTDIHIDEGTLEYIFMKDKYETETVFADALKLCNSDLESRVKNEKVLFDTAQKNAISAIEGLFRPWIETADPEFLLEVR